jgi:hypothetical protein
METGSDDRDFIHPEASSPPKTDADVAPLIQKVGAPSIAQIEKLIGELHEARNLLEAEGERIQRETARYIKFTQMASASVKIISETLSGWRQAGLDPAAAAMEPWSTFAGPFGFPCHYSPP